MEKSKKFRVYKSSVYLLGRIETFVMIFVPLLLRDLLSPTLSYICCGFFAFVWLYYMLVTGGTVTVETDGISCRRPLKKPVLLKWSDIVCSGCFVKRVYSKELNFRYFSSKPLESSVLDADAAPPRLSETLVFAVNSPELEAAVKNHSTKNGAYKKPAADTGTPTDGSASPEKLKKLITADVILLAAVIAVYLLKNSLLQLWLPLLIALCTASAVLSAIIVYLKSKS